MVLILLASTLFVNIDRLPSYKARDFQLLALIMIVVGIGVLVCSLFLFTSVYFIKGINEKAPKKCFPYVIVLGSQAIFILTLIVGLDDLNISLVIIAGIRAYCCLVAYSLYKVLIYGDEVNACEANQNAGSAGYEQFYESEGYNAIKNSGYQATELKETPSQHTPP